jgi:hypothetical protein
MATIAAKLAASEREADAARVRAKLKAARMARTGRAAGNPVLAPPDGTATAEVGGSAGEPVKRHREREGNLRLKDSEGGSREARQGLEVRTESGAGESKEDIDAVDLIVEKPRKRERRTSKAASRRRSTLNPWELQSLIQGDVGTASAAEGS